MAWNYNRIGEDGRLKSYYGVGQKWTYVERDIQHTITVKYFAATPGGVQYYLIAIDDRFQEKRLSAARLHYLLNSKKANEVQGGSLQPMPLLIEEVEAYFNKNISKRADCPYCGGYGVDRGRICFCAERFAYEIKNFNAEQRLKKLTNIQ